MENLKKVTIYSDGACKNNPGKGGWGAVLIFGEVQKEIYGGKKNTTNNQMELQGAISGLEALKYRCDVVVYTDSNYVVQGMNSWRHKWKKEHRLTPGNPKEVANAELWNQLIAIADFHKTTFKWIKGHSGHPLNDLADRLANKGLYWHLYG